MLCKYSHIKYESLAPIRSTIAGQGFFSEAVVFIGALCSILYNFVCLSVDE